MARAPSLVFLRGLGQLATVLTLLLWAEAAVAGSGDFDAAVRRLGQASPDAVARAVESLGATGDPRALGVLEALRDGDVVVDDAGGVFVHGVPPGPGPRHSPAIDNSVRRVLAPLIARLELLAPDPAVRLSGVAEIASQASSDDQVALRDALEHEKDKTVRRALTAALAELDLASDDVERRLGAVRAIESEGSERLRPKLATLAERRDDGSYAEPDARVREAAARVVRSLDRRQFVMSRVADLLYGLSMGSILLLSSLGLAITFGVMRVINMAHGEMLMLGAYATYETQVFFAAHLPGHESFYLLAAVPVALLVTMAVGAVLERTVIRFLYGRPLETLLATYGLSLLLIQTVRSIFGAQNVAVANPPFLSGGTEIFEGVVIPYNRVAVVLFTIAVVSFISYMLRGTPLGLRVRAVTQNRPMAACMGIRTARVDTWTFAMGSGVGGLGGVALSQLGNVGPDLGQSYIVDSFLVVVLGGVGKLAGSVFAAFSLGIVNKLLEPIAGAVLGKIVVLLLVVLIIQKRPQGLFAPRGRSVESA
ncbi:MAG: urea ABC transporter permease subunit UrtB [Polyangiaceae bacterium]|jgi:urea transport system permease protein